jgi:hypothetical protein
MTNLGRAMLAGALGIASLFGTAHRAAADDACFYRGTMYSEGGMSCQNGRQYKCDDGEWDDTDSPCQPERVAASKPCSFEGISYSTGSASCQAGTQFRCEDGSWRNLGSQCAMLSGNTIKVEPSGDTCMYEGATVASGSTICKSSSTFLCNDGAWVNLGTLCR